MKNHQLKLKDGIDTEQKKNLKILQSISTFAVLVVRLNIRLAIVLTLGFTGFYSTLHTENSETISLLHILHEAAVTQFLSNAWEYESIALYKKITLIEYSYMRYGTDY